MRRLAPVVTGGRLVTGALILLGASGVLAGCGSSGPSLSAPAAQRLQALVAQVRSASQSDDPALAASDLAQLRSAVSTLKAQGQVSSSKATAILAAATQVQNLLVELPTTTTTTTTTTLPPSTDKPPGPTDHHKGPGGPGGDQGGG